MNPVQPMIEFFLDLYSLLPASLLALIDFGIVLFAVAILFGILQKVR